MTIYRLMIDDNFHYQDESHRYEHDTFSDLNDAVAACKSLIDRELEHMATGSTTAKDETDLYNLWIGFGIDPFILAEPRDETASDLFSASAYARSRCPAIMAAAKSQPIDSGAEDGNERTGSEEKLGGHK